MVLKQSDFILSGATAPEQVRENVAALNINLSDDTNIDEGNGQAWSVKYSTRFTSVSLNRDENLRFKQVILKVNIGYAIIALM
ncbi:hypothetical protein ACLBR5_16220 [Escherichia coli]